MTETPIAPSSLDLHKYQDEEAAIARLVEQAALSTDDRARICAAGANLVKDIRSLSSPGLMEVFLAEYGLSTDEGIALMCLAEALLRVPDADTIDALIEDKIAPSDWGKHLGHSASPLVNASTWALMLTGRVLDDERQAPFKALRGAVRRLGEPVIRTAVGRAMKEMGRQFVLGESISSAMKRAAGMEAKGYTYSYDMLGEAARTEADATRYHLSYSRAITAIAEACTSTDIRENPGISVKLSALHPRYERAQRQRVMQDLVPRLRSLALLAKSANMGLNVDAEEADRLALSLEVIDEVLAEPALAGWDGFGVVVQAYGPRTGEAIDALYGMAERYDRKLMVRLVKGAYWDTEIKRAQVMGMDAFPVFTRKAATDISYIANARKLLGMTDRIYPQFATHNAHTVSAILHMAGDLPFEFQRLHGMGEALHNIVKEKNRNRCRIYAPVGAHRDLLAYLVRRLLENGANSSFVNQIVDKSVPPEQVAADPFESIKAPAPHLATGAQLFAPERPNSAGFDLTHVPTLERIEEARAPFRTHTWSAAPLLAGSAAPEEAVAVQNPADAADTPGTVAFASAADVASALSAARPWAVPASERAAALNRAADLYEANFGEIFALLAREAGKSIPDAVAELREAVDFLRYYAAHIPGKAPAGTFTCISPWNFPLAIFTGQIAAALVTGNAVLAKPSSKTSLIAARATELWHDAGLPPELLQLVPYSGAEHSETLLKDYRLAGVVFTGSSATASELFVQLSQRLGAPLPVMIAETGGLNAMIADSTALPEQVVKDVIRSAFASAGQRCSALRVLYLQEEIADIVTEKLIGATKELKLGDPHRFDVDVGPIIDKDAMSELHEHIELARAQDRVLYELPIGSQHDPGYFVPPTILRLHTMDELTEETFGPVLHIVRFSAERLDQIVDEINRSGYGLTLGIHSRNSQTIHRIVDAAQVGNIYVNRDQIGAVVGSQPFGGMNLSGTGPKAGGPHYLLSFVQEKTITQNSTACGGNRQLLMDADGD